MNHPTNMDASSSPEDISALLASFVFFPDAESATKSDNEPKENAALQSAIEAKNAGNIRYQESKYDDAIAMYTNGISQLQGTDDKCGLRELAFCYQNRAAAYEKQKLFDKAVVDATKAIELNVLYAKAYFRRAKIYIGQEKYYCALQDIVQACILARYGNESYNQIAADLNSRFESDTSTSHGALAFKELGGKTRTTVLFRQDQLRLLKDCGVLDTIIVQFATDVPNKGYVRAMKGLSDMDENEIMSGCKEEIFKRGEYLAQSYILLGYMHTVVFSYTPTMDKHRDLEELEYIITNVNTSKEIKFSARLCRANVYDSMTFLWQASSILNELETEYPDNALIYVIKSGMLTSQTFDFSPDRYKSVCRCCDLLPSFYAAQYLKIDIEWKDNQGRNNLFANSQFESQLKEQVVRFPKLLSPRLILFALYCIEERVTNASDLLMLAERDFPDETEKLDRFRACLQPLSPTVVELYKNAINHKCDDHSAYLGLFMHFVYKEQLANALEVANKALTECMDEELYLDMFKLRQETLTEIVRQNLWNDLRNGYNL